MNDIINIYQRQMKGDLLYNVIENYYYNLINIIDNYFINKELVKRCLNLHIDYDNNIIKILELENTNRSMEEALKAERYNHCHDIYIYIYIHLCIIL